VAHALYALNASRCRLLQRSTSFLSDASSGSHKNLKASQFSICPYVVRAPFLDFPLAHDMFCRYAQRSHQRARRSRCSASHAGSARRLIHCSDPTQAPRRASHLETSLIVLEGARVPASTRVPLSLRPMEPMVELPLLERMQQLDVAHFPLLPAVDGSASGSFCGAGSASQALRMPSPGEQYRFHFDMTKCIGCKCCVVACNEQNGNPADILWRRVGEIEGGTYPATLRHYLSLGCNHCLEPTCMTGCPVNAYNKDSITGIVRHSAEACIGCQYCTWNCSYGVPQYNPERGVVGKCDMCYGRLMHNESPACASACPENAIEIELVRIDEWRREYKAQANSPGMPSADDSISTTRITLPAQASHDLQKVNLGHLRTEHPHWPLIIMTVLTQLSTGAFTAIWSLQLSGAGTHRASVLAALGAALLALTASTLHLGRPIHAARALKMWRRSWLSREVLLFTISPEQPALTRRHRCLERRSSPCREQRRSCSDLPASSPARVSILSPGVRRGILRLPFSSSFQRLRFLVSLRRMS
jgi:DMSO reductase iron-sulfur subunit